jgi:hypothetical protein
MAAINPDWYAGNATRAYPLDDAATARDDAGLELPPQVLVDCRVRFPLALGRYAYVGGLTVGPNIVTAVLLAADNTARPPAGTPAGGSGTPLGAVSLPTPVVPFRHYPIRPMADGVGGWLVFGPGIDEPYSGRFTAPIQSLLLPRVASAYSPLPVPTLGKLGVDPPLAGVIQLLGATDLEVVQDTREIGGAIVDVIILRLVDSLNRNVFGLYAGPCAGRPESGTCTRPAVESINGVMPDCAGDLTLEFRGAQPLAFAGGGGIALDLALGMAETCTGQDYLPDGEGNLPGDYEGECPPATPPQVPPPEGPTTPPGGGLPPVPGGCVVLPYYESFDGLLPTPWTVMKGSFAMEADDSPGEPYGLYVPGTGTGGVAGLGGLPPWSRAARTSPPPGMVPVNQSYCAVDTSQRCVAVWNCDYDIMNLDLTCTTHLKIMPGPQMNGGILLYGCGQLPAAVPPTNYIYWQFSVDIVDRSITINTYNGSYMTWTEKVYFDPGGVPVPGDWYQLTARLKFGLPPDFPAPDPPGTRRIDLNLTGVTDPSFLPKSWHNIYAGQVGVWPIILPQSRFGLGAINSHVRFSFFQLELTPPGTPP